MDNEDELAKLSQRATVVVFHSPVTDLGGLDGALTRAGVDWAPVELGMGSAANRELFHALQSLTGRRTLPQCFVHGQFVGGIEALPRCVDPGALPPKAAAWMGYAGLLPFMAGMVGMWAAVPGAASWLVAYGAVILAFVGALHWGSAASRGAYGARVYCLSVVPALVAWLGLLLPVGMGLSLMGVAFVGWRLAEHLILDRWQPGWLTRLRSRLTLGASASLLVGAGALAFW